MCRHYDLNITGYPRLPDLNIFQFSLLRNARSIASTAPTAPGQFFKLSPNSRAPSRYRESRSTKKGATLLGNALSMD